mmetsp:Transcript_37104/g.86945  ORF Transcript_37104/g.86945 Transcript_37104/m.86945 type:complete len:560 (-) Transcript_37104:197-1876(-)
MSSSVELMAVEEASPQSTALPSGDSTQWSHWIRSAPVFAVIFLISWQEDFPETAMTSLMTDELKMSLAAIATTYALTFLPWMWKPLYGWLSDNFPMCGYHRKPYFLLGTFGAALAYATTAMLVSNAQGLLAANMCRSAALAMTQLMTDAFVVDIARLGYASASTLQGYSNACKWAGTGLAQLAAFCFYTRGAERKSGAAIAHARQAIGFTAVAQGMLLLLAPALPEVRKFTPGLGSCAQRCAASTAGSWRFAVTLLVFQADLVLIGCRGLMHPDRWLQLLWAAAPLSLLLVAAVQLLPLKGWRGHSSRASAEVQGQLDTAASHASWRWVVLCLFIFMANAIPDSTIAIGQLKFRVFTPSSYQGLSMVSSLSSVLASCLFAIVFRKCRIVPMFIALTFLSTLFSLGDLPFVLMTYKDPPSNAWLWSRYGFWAAFGAFTTSLASMCGVLALDTLVTSVASGMGVSRSSTVYASLLSLYSCGAVVEGLIGSAALDAQGLTGKNWQALPRWTCMTASFRLMILVLLPMVKFGVPNECYMPGVAASLDPDERHVRGAQLIPSDS